MQPLSFSKKFDNCFELICKMRSCRISKIVAVLLMGISGLFCGCCSSQKPPTVKNLDAQKYMGIWYEIARIETPFQRGKFNSKALYSLRKDGRIDIVNSAENSKGEISSARAVAYAPNANDVAQLRVSFFWPFYSDYLVLFVDNDYQNALVGGSSKNYLWILSRSQEIAPEKLKEILQYAKSLGYDTSKLLFNSELKKFKKLVN